MQMGTICSRWRLDGDDNSDGSTTSAICRGNIFPFDTEQNPYERRALLGTTTDSNTYGGDAASNQFTGIELSTGETGAQFDFRMLNVGG